MPTLTGLRDVVRSLGTPEQLYLERKNGVTVNDEGTAVEAAPSIVDLGMRVVHPISGKDRSLFEEGVRTRELIVAYVTEPVRTTKENGEMADVLIRRPTAELDDVRYVVQTAEDWSGPSGHYRAFASRIPQE